VNAEKAAAVARCIQSRGGEAIFLNVDVREHEKVKSAVAEVVDQFGRVDVLVNSAGYNKFVPPQELTHEYWETMRSINLDGTWNFCHAVMYPMMEQRSGKIINIGSAGAVLGYPQAPGYIAAKHGVVGLTRALAVDLGSYGINVNCVCPGPIDTPLLTESTDQAFRDGIVRHIPLGRLGKPSDIANACLFLASCLSDWISGVVLPTDGGLVSCVRAKHNG
jgi:NAD(P)-dependent dehydrogenase (short-subunit alcohol dehydrogenase family)